MDVTATVYESSAIPRQTLIPHFKDVYPNIQDFFKEQLGTSNVLFNENNRILKYKGSQMTFYLYFSPLVRRYFLCIFPKNVWRYAYKNQLIPALNTAVDFFNSLPDSFQVNNISFNKSNVTDAIDISDWTFTTTPEITERKITTLSNFRGIKSVCSELFHQITVLDKTLLVIDVCNYKYKSFIKQLESNLTPFFAGGVEVFEGCSTIMEQIENRVDKDKLFVLFVGTKPVVDRVYTKYKHYFINNHIPSQFIGSDENIEQILKWGFQNLVLEILKKANKKDTISLDLPGIDDIDGYLCLSDVFASKEAESLKLFGLTLSFSGDNSTEEWLEIYDDINYSTNYDDIKFNESDLSVLSEKISALSNLNGKTIDIFVTKRWSHYNINFLINSLEKNGISTRKVYYISQKSNRFVFSSLPNEDAYLFKHPFILWDERVASIQTNSRMQIYGTMFPIYIELMNPNRSNVLTEDDLERIVWLVKKRIYRIANFFNLKVPEQVSLMHKANKLRLKNISGRMKISVHTLI